MPAHGGIQIRKQMLAGAKARQRSFAASKP
jgi:hypothetical protein